MAESYDLSQHELLVSPAAGSTRLKISDKAGSISLTLDVKKDDKTAIACMKPLLGPLIALLTKEMDESPNQAGWAPRAPAAARSATQSPKRSYSLCAYLARGPDARRSPEVHIEGAVDSFIKAQSRRDRNSGAPSRFPFHPL